MIRKAVWLAAAILAGAATQALADAPEIRFARQFSMGYLQFNLMEKHQLLEKHAKAAGIPDVKVVWATFNSPTFKNQGDCVSQHGRPPSGRSGTEHLS